MLLSALRRREGLANSIRVTMALVLALPANAVPLLAGDGLPPTPPRSIEGSGPLLDIDAFVALDVEPETGSLLLGLSDLELGFSESKLALQRQWRELDSGDFGPGWSSTLSQRLEGLGSDELCLVDATGHRRWFVRDGESYIAALGLPARIVSKDGALELSGLGDEKVHRFDTQGRILSQSGRGGLLASWTYENDKLVALSSGRDRLEIVRDEAGRVTQLRATGGKTAHYRYGADGRLSEVTNASGALFSYAYDKSGRLASVNRDAATIRYDSIGRVTRLAGKHTRERKLFYMTSADPWRSYITLIEDGEGRLALVAQSYDRRLTERVSEDGRRTTVEVDERDRPVAIIDPLGQKWEYGYDSQGRPSVIEGPEGVTTLDYADDSARPSRISRGAERWTFSYDAQGNLTRLTSPSGGSEQMEYNEAGRVARAVDIRGLERKYSYDEMGRVSSVSDSLGQTTRFEYDGAHRMTRFVRGDGRALKISYDPAGRPTRVAEEGGRDLRMEYNRFGKLAARVDERGQRTELDYTSFGELASIRDSLGLQQAYEYDRAGRLIAATDALGNRSSYTYREGQYIVTGPNGDQRRFELDPSERVRREVTPNGQKIDYDYDSRGLLTAMKTPDGDVSRFAYDKAGRLSFMANAESQYRIAYDALGRISALNDEKLGKSIGYEYNAAGDRTSMTLPFGKVQYQRDALGRITCITDIDGGKIEIGYLFDGRRESLRYPNGVSTRFEYDSQDRLTAIVTKSADGAELSARRYEYDSIGRRSAMTDERGQREEYGYDARGRITEIRRPGQAGQLEQLSYDLADNRTSRSIGGKEQRYVIGKGNQVLSDGNEKLEYDLAGRLVRRISKAGISRYIYDARDKLIRVEKPGGVITKFGYAPNGTRVWSEKNGKRRYYLYDFADVVAEFDGSGELVRSYTHGPGDDDVLATHAETSRAYYHYDAVRSVVAMTDNDGKVVGRFDYSVFGELRSAEGAASRWNPYTFTSQRRDPGVDLQFFRARYYDPSLGRFTSLDPAGFYDGANRYAYARNNPVLYNDPYGLWSVRGLWDSAVSSVSDAASATARFAGKAWEVTSTAATHIGKNPVAFAKGFGKGLWNGVEGVYNLVTHPVETFNGVMYAVEHWDETKEALKKMGAAYVEAFKNDPEKFADLSGQILGEVVFAVAGTKGLDKVAKVANVAKLGQGAARVSRATGLTRAAGNVANTVTRNLGSAGRAIAGTGRQVGAAIARRAPKVAAAARVLSQRAGQVASALKTAAADTARRARVIDRANQMRKAAIAARGGNIVTRSVRAVGRAPGRIAATAKLAVRDPGAFIAYGAYAMTRGSLRLAAAMGRGTFQMGKTAAIPAVLIFDDQVTDSINRYESREAALGDVQKGAEALLADAANLSPEELQARLDSLGQTYNDYRNNLLRPVHGETQAFERELENLNKIAEEAIGSGDEKRMDAAISRMSTAVDRWATRRDVLLTDLYEGSKEVEHSYGNPSPNRRLAFDDEAELLRKARERATDPRSQAALDARIAEVEAARDLEYELYRSGDHEALLGHLAGQKVDIEKALGVPGLAGESPALNGENGQAEVGAEGRGAAGALEELFRD